MRTDQYLKLLTEIGERRPKFTFGDYVVDAIGRRGVVHVIYANLYAAINSFSVPADWYEMQQTMPKTAKEGFWYAVLLTSEYGDLLVGEDDMEAVQ